MTVALTAPAADAATLIGSSVVQSGTDSDSSGTAEAFQATAAASGTVAQLVVYLDTSNAATRVVVGLFSDSSGHPASLLTQATISAPVKGAWNTVTVPPVALTSGTSYWLAILSPSGAGVVHFRDNLGGGHSVSSSATNLSVLPATWTTGATWPDGPISMYATSAANTTPVLTIAPASLSFTGTAGGTNPAAASLSITNTGGGTLSFTSASNQSWLAATPASGTAPATETVSVSIAGLAAGTYTGQVTVTATGATGSPAAIPVTLTLTGTVNTSGDWPMVGQNVSRTGFASNDTVINKSNVANLELLWSVNLDGKVSAQPLFLGGVSINSVSHDVVIAASNQNSVYAYDASTGALLWFINLGANTGGYSAVPGGLGIQSAPAVDRATNRIFVVSDDGKLHTISLITGTELVPALQLIDLPVTNKVRGGLSLFANTLYVASGSDGNDDPPWRGRIYRLDVSAAAPVLVSTFDVVPSIAGDNRGGGISSYGGVSVDPATGSVYAATGVDYSEADTPYAARMIKLTPTLYINGYYEPPQPTNVSCASAPCGVDFSATPTVFTPTTCPTMVAAGNKDGHLYVLRTTDFSTSSAAFQSLAVNAANASLANGGLGGIPAFWPAGNMLFVTDSGSGIAGVPAGVIGLSISPAPLCQVSIAWAVPLPNQGSAQSSPTVVGDVVLAGEGATGVVHAFDAATGTELWNSGSTVSGNTFAAPTIGNGKVFVGSWTGATPADFGILRAFALGAGSGVGGCTGRTPPVLAGTQTLEPNVDMASPGQAEAFQVTSAACGMVNSLNLYVNTSSTAGMIVVGLYADNAGHPGTLLTQASISAPVAGAWNQIKVPPVSVTASTPYWIAVLGTASGAVAFRDAPSGCSSETSALTTLATLPSTWTSGSAFTSCPLSAYAASSALAVAPTYTITGAISPASGGAGAVVALSGAASGTTTADASGKYSFAGLANGNYTVTPTNPGYSFNPTNRPVTVNGANVTGVNFAATAVVLTYTISGTISPASSAAGAVVTLGGAANATTTVDASGNYSFTGISNGSYTVTPSSQSATFSPASQPVTVSNANVGGVNFTATATANVIFYDDFAGTSLGSAWSIIQRRGPPSQAENECNTAGAVGVSDSILTITTSATPATCGDAITAPTQLPYTSGDIQWSSLNFTYGTVEVRAKFPPQNTGTWPAIWLLGANCQAANLLNGSESVAYDGCPAQGDPAYQEIDMVECDLRSWCHVVVAQGSAGWSSLCPYQVDANWHVFTLTWNASIVSMAVDGNSTGCGFGNTSLHGPMFLIMQTQTTMSSGVAGLPNNANLPTSFQIDYVKVTQP